MFLVGGAISSIVGRIYPTSFFAYTGYPHLTLAFWGIMRELARLIILVSLFLIIIGIFKKKKTDNNLTKDNMQDRKIMPQENKQNRLGIASLVIGILSIILCWTWFGLVSGILGIVFYRRQKIIYPNGIARAGFITSIIGLVLVSIIVISAIIIGILSPVPK